MHRRQRRGFTLIELLIGVAIAGIASAIALPSYRQYVDDAAVATRAERLLSSLMLARLEAVKRNTRVTVCRSDDGSSCKTGAPAGDWRTGWLVFVDGDDVGVRNSADTILAVQNRLGDTGTVVGSGDVANFVSYTSNGQARLAGTAAQNGTLSICATGPTSKRRRITVSSGSGWAGSATLAASANCNL